MKLENNEIKLSDAFQCIKDIYLDVLSGKHFDKFDLEETERIIKVGFLLYNLSLIKYRYVPEIEFKYNDYRCSIVMSRDIHDNDEEFYTSTIMNTDIFKNAFKEFIRENKINKIINE